MCMNVDLRYLSRNEGSGEGEGGMPNICWLQWVHQVTDGLPYSMHCVL